MSTNRRRIRNQQVPVFAAMPILALNARGEEMLGSMIDDGFVVDSVDLDYGYNVESNDRTDDVFVLNSPGSYNAETIGTVSGVIAASEDSIKNLEEITIDGTTESSSSIVCSICLGPLPIGSKAIRMPNPCSHVYHKDCITTWLHKSNTCPLCRRSVPS